MISSRVGSMGATYLRILKAYCGWLVEKGVLLHHPMAKMPHPNSRRTRRTEFFTGAERDRVLAGCGDREDLRMILMLGFYAGLRFAEILAVRWDWIWITEGGGLAVQAESYFLPKGKEMREIPLHPMLLEALRESKERTEGKGGFVVRPEKAV